MGYKNAIPADHFQGGANLSQAEGGTGPDMAELLRGLEKPALSEQITKFQAGTITVTTTVPTGGPYIVPRAGKITKVSIHARVCGTAGATTVDFNINGTSIFAASGDRPSIDNAAADGSVATAVPTATGAGAVVAGDLITADIDVAPTAGSDLTMQIEVEFNAY